MYQTARNLPKVSEKSAIDVNDTNSSVYGGHAKGSNFYLMAIGQIELGSFPGYDNMYCRYSFVFGDDWEVVHGLEIGISQISRNGGRDEVIWNFPIDISFKSTCAFGWPRIAFSVYTLDWLGRDSIVGYGSHLVPVFPGNHTSWVLMYAPKSSSPFQQIRGWITGSYPEFFDSKHVAQSEARDVVRVQRKGKLKCSLSVMTRGMGALGYDIGASSYAPSILNMPKQLERQQN